MSMSRPEWVAVWKMRERTPIAPWVPVVKFYTEEQAKEVFSQLESNEYVEFKDAAVARVELFDSKP